MKKNTVYLEYEKIEELNERIITLENENYKLQNDRKTPAKTIVVDNLSGLFSGKYTVETDEEAVEKLAKDFRETKSKLRKKESEINELRDMNRYEFKRWKSNS